MKTNRNTEEEYEQPIDFAGFFFRYITYWKWFLASLILCLLFAEIYLKIATPEYETTTSVLLKDDLKGDGTAEMNAFKDMGLLSVKNNVDNELEVLNKSILVEQVVRELGIYSKYTEIKTIPVISNLGIDTRSIKIGALNSRIIYGNECPILIRLPEAVLDTLNIRIELEVTVHPNGIYEFSGTWLKKDYNIKASISDNQVVLPFGKILIARGNLRPAEDMIVKVVIQSPAKVAKESIQQLKMELTSKTTSVVNISFISSNLKLGTDFLKKLIEV